MKDKGSDKSWRSEPVSCFAIENLCLSSCTHFLTFKIMQYMQLLMKENSQVIISRCHRGCCWATKWLIIKTQSISWCLTYGIWIFLLHSFADSHINISVLSVPPSDTVVIYAEKDEFDKLKAPPQKTVKRWETRLNHRLPHHTVALWLKQTTESRQSDGLLRAYKLWFPLEVKSLYWLVWKHVVESGYSSDMSKKVWV